VTFFFAPPSLRISANRESFSSLQGWPSTFNTNKMPSVVDRSSGYVLEWNLRTIDLSKTYIFSPRFSFYGIQWQVTLVKASGKGKLGIYLNSVPRKSFPGTIRFQFDLMERIDHRIGKSVDWSTSMYNVYRGLGISSWIDRGTIRDHILKVKMWIGKSFSDFAKKPDSFYDHRSILFVKGSSDFSFRVQDEVVYVVRYILTCRSDYFRAMLTC
jgi:hypothetical protein